ncbi:DUF2189 domain-containing protein [Rhodocyclaceae bacterium SMB388]
MDPTRPQPVPVSRRDLIASLSAGWASFRLAPMLSMGFAAIFSVIGTVLISGAIGLGLAPMSWALAGGFLLVGPVILSGFFGITAALREQRKPALRDVVRGLGSAPRGLVGLSLVCILLFVIWMTDAGILYSFMVGDTASEWVTIVPLTEALLRFKLGAFTMGAVFALIVFCISAYSVPLLLQRRASLVTAISASVRAVFMSPTTHFAWAVLLAVVILISAMLTPLLIPALPLLAFASEELYRRTFPQ